MAVIEDIMSLFPELEFVFDCIGDLNPDRLHLRLKSDLHVFLDDELGVTLILASFEVNREFYKMCVRGNKESLLRINTYVAMYDVFKNSEYVGFMAVLANPNVVKAVV